MKTGVAGHNRKVAVLVASFLACWLSASHGKDKDVAPSKAPVEQTSGEPHSLWQADLGNGFYKNPVLHADYSDPDVVAAGDDFYMTASSFNSAPGLPVLHSKDLVNWELIGYALKNLVPEEVFDVPQHGNGVWAPNIRYHEGKLWIFYPDPDFGIYMTQSEVPITGEWTKPVLILPGKGIIDPTVLWDENGQAWLLHGWAKSRSGINNILTLHKMSPDGTEIIDEGRVIIDGHQLPGYRTLEGPKFYKRNGYYYVFAPAGGVPVGWQAVFRSRTIDGPYEYRTVLEQGNTPVNGPHQGAWVQTQTGEDWFFHFQSKFAYGRIVHLQPMQWVDDWPVIGSDTDGDGIGNPVGIFRKPDVGKSRSSGLLQVKTLPSSDEFDAAGLGLQWQWNANSRNSWYSLSERDGFLRLYAQPAPRENSGNLWMTPSLLLQKLPAPEFIAEATFEIPESARNLSAGLIMFGEDYAWIGIRQNESNGETKLVYANCHGAPDGCSEDFVTERTLDSHALTVRMTVTNGGGTVFSYREDSGRFRAIGELFQAKPGRWVGAKLGLFARIDDPHSIENEDYIDVDCIRFYLPLWAD